ncbi:MAG: hypothetical protein QW625_01220 [Candidatus Nanoarchaeia archaeon]
MTSIEFISKKPISFVELLSHLKELKKNRRTEFHDKILSFAKKNAKLSPTNCEKLMKELTDANIIGLGDEEKVTIINILPRTMGELRSILSNNNLSQDSLKKIYDIVSKYTAEKSE